MRAVGAKVYSKKYFETDCGGHEMWRKSCGKDLPPRLEYAFNIADICMGMNVLDWGCGRGELSYQAARVGADVLGLDYAKDAIELTKKLPKDTKGKLKFAQIDDLLIPAKDNSFDRILFVDVIEHLYPEQLKILMKEFARVLKPGGKLVIHTFPNLDHYNFGYPRFTRWAHMMTNPIWQLLFHEKLRDSPSPRFGYDSKVHVNECSLTMVKDYVEAAKLVANVWYDSEWRMIRRRDKIRYNFFQPLWLSNKYFADDIWAIGTK
ncbi:MAG: methyltransferase domain-containing protein [bacterium]